MLEAFLLVCLSCSRGLKAQEFPKGWLLYLEGQQGGVTDFTANPDLYTGGLTLNPAYCLIENHLRLGAVAGMVYTNKIIDAVFGPRLAWKLKTLPASNLGTIGNIQLQAEWLWGGSGQRLIGGGPKIELLERLQAGVTAHRDYNLNAWWFQAVIGYKLIKTPKKAAPHREVHHIF